jgi:hypothetical protein
MLSSYLAAERITVRVYPRKFTVYFQHLANFVPHIQYLLNSYLVVTFALRKVASYDGLLYTPSAPFNLFSWFVLRRYYYLRQNTVVECNND